MKFIMILFLGFAAGLAHAQMPNLDQIHCGYDFTSYLVVHPHEAGNNRTIDGLHIFICDEEGNEVLNENFKLSWKYNNKPLYFIRNYRIDNNNKRIESLEEGKWFYYFAQNHYLVTVANTFPADNYFIKIEDRDGEANGGHYKTQIIPLGVYNMYVLCESDERQQAMTFGRKMNRPIDVVMEKM
mgnify:CR=1 FL=1